MIEMAITCLALNLYHEARGEPEIGQWAVAQVTMNRAEHDPAKVCDTVFKPRQFSWTNPLVEAPTPEIRRARAENYMPREAQAWELAKKIARRTLQGRGRNVVGGATHYHADYVAPRWASTFSQVAQIGSHVFYAQLHPFDQSIALVLTTACIRLGQWAAETQQAETGQKQSVNHALQ